MRNTEREQKEGNEKRKEKRKKEFDLGIEGERRSEDGKEGKVGTKRQNRDED
jgi:hypothetical protein